MKMNYDKYAAKLMNEYPAIEDLQRRAHQRMPLVGREYLETGTDFEYVLRQNRESLQKINFKPRFLIGELCPNIETDLFGRKYNAPFGIAPVGLTGLMWPRAEHILAQTASKYNIPFCLSTVATETPETVGPLMGDSGWFQLYTPREDELTRKILGRARNSGFHTLVITIDIPLPSRRQRTKRAGLQTPPKMTFDFFWEALKNPTWTFKTLQNGIPRLRTIESYSEFKDMMSVGDFVVDNVGGNLSWDYVKRIRDMWEGPVILKGIMHEKDAEIAVEQGFDGIVVSNHGARQFDGTLASIDVLPDIVKVVDGKIKVLFDSGVRSGMDIIRALALGADFVLCGRAYLYGVGALGNIGGCHTTEILIGEMKNYMTQLGIQTLDEIKNLTKTHI